jgi:hypothetical protein
VTKKDVSRHWPGASAVREREEEEEGEKEEETGKNTAHNCMAQPQERSTGGKKLNTGTPEWALSV